jgi:hypothetical protein
MKSFIVAALALACVVASTSAFARDGHRTATTGAAGHVSRDPATRLAPAAPQAPVQNPIPAPLSPPAQAPTINGPSPRSPYGGVMR